MFPFLCFFSHGRGGHVHQMETKPWNKHSKCASTFESNLGQLRGRRLIWTAHRWLLKPAIHYVPTQPTSNHLRLMFLWLSLWLRLLLSPHITRGPVKLEPQGVVRRRKGGKVTLRCQSGPTSPDGVAEVVEKGFEVTTRRMEKEIAVNGGWSRGRDERWWI